MRKDLCLVKRALLSLFALVAIAMGARAQYVFVIPNGCQVRAALSIEELESGDFSSEMQFLWDVTPGTTVYFDFRPLTDYHFKEIKFLDNNQAVDVSTSVDDNGVYSFAMPDGVTYLNVQVIFEETYIPPTGVNINEENFPDKNFRNWLIAQSYGKDKVITDQEMAGIMKIVAQGCGIEDLTGIQFFTKLIELDVSNLPSKHAVEDWNKIASIDLSGNTKLQKLSIDNNLLTTINLAPCPDLTNLQISSNSLTALDVSYNSFLSNLFCEDNQITALDLSNNPDLSLLGCSGNRLTALNVSSNTNLNQLYCSNNQIATLDVSNHNKLIILNCNDNQLTSLNVSGCTELFQLYCYNNKIKGEAMTAFVNSLPTPPHGGYMVVFDLESETEENEMTDEQIAAAKAKGWSVEACLDDGYVSYPYDPNVHQYVDLGLPSGTLWATTNIGATHSYQSGLFFAWGDTEGHGSDVSDGYLFSWENYKWGEVIDEATYFTKYCTDSSRGKDGFADGKYELDLEDDAAYVNWGPEWRMPSKEQFDELRNVCTWTRMFLGDVYGYDVEGPNGRSIFLPDTGWRIDDVLNDGGAFWSRSANPEATGVGGAYYLGWPATGDEPTTEWYEYGGRLDGQCVRPVYNAVKVTLNSDGEGNYWATFYSDASYTADENATVYTAQVSDDKTEVILAEVADKTIPADNAVVLKSSVETVTMTCADGVSGTLADNDLQGSATEISTPENTYMLVKGSRGVGFYHWTGETIPAGRGYLTLNDAAATPSFLSISPGYVTVIETVERTTEESGIIYDLTGRRLSASPRQGIYVRNGKKFIVK